MGHDITPSDRRPSVTDCSTSTSFDDHGVTRSSDLLTDTYNRLGGTDAPVFEPTEAFFERLEEAFMWAYLGAVDEGGIPMHVEAAIDDARVLTSEEFRDDPVADLRTDVLPTFFQHVAGFHCAYHH